jgi:hypothetical protein
MNNSELCNKTIATLGLTEYVIHGDPPTKESEFSNINAITGADESSTAILSQDAKDIGFTWSEYETKYKEIEAAYDAQEYARNRAAEYPDTGDQFNKIYDDGLDKWKTEMVDPVKAKWPKDNSGPK